MGYILGSDGKYILDSDGDPISDSIPLTTPLRLIIRALKKTGVLGVGQGASAEDVQDAFDDLNDMIGQWARKRWLIYRLTDDHVVSTGQQSYSIGPGGDFNIPRPDRLESAFMRQINTAAGLQTDYPLRILQSREDYNRVPLKGLVAFSGGIFYDPQYPLGLIYPVSITPGSNYEIHISLKQPLGGFFSLTQTINLPPEYNEALLYNLACRLRPAYQLTPDPSIVALAEAALNVIKNANAQVPLLKLPRAIRGRRGGYNFYSDNTY